MDTPLNSKNPSQQSQQPQKQPLHVEIIVHPYCPTPLQDIENEAKRFLSTQCISQIFTNNQPIQYVGLNDMLTKCCISITVVDLDISLLPCRADADGESTEAIIESKIAYWQISEIIPHACILSDEETSMECICLNDNDDEEMEAAECLMLPHSTLHGLWDSLILPRPIKCDLLEYTATALLFSEKSVSHHIITWNRVVLLHGPPGTGKTSLCRALAQKLSMRLIQRRFPAGAMLLEIHSHSLFSKWFSESGKMVSKLFAHISELVEDKDLLLFVLIDEVESLAAERSNSGNEPGDAIRTVNAMLTGLDKLSKCENVMILTTTNLTGAVDLAFVDRADIKQYIGLPPVEGRFEILRSCILELIRVGIITAPPNNDKAGSNRVAAYREVLSSLHRRQYTNTSDNSGDTSMAEDHASSENGPSQKVNNSSYLDAGKILLLCAQKSEGLSGRTLRKLPFQSHALFVRSKSAPLCTFLQGLLNGIDREHASRENLKANS